MAAGQGDLVGAFRNFCRLADSKKDDTHFTMKAAGKLAEDCFVKKHGKSIKNICDNALSGQKGTSQFIVLNNDSVEKFLAKVALDFIILKTNKPKTPADDPEVLKLKAELKADVLAKGKPEVKKVKESVTGNVAQLTDSSGFTGTSKAQFKDGKGLGKAGRVDIVENDGYVHGYGNKGTFDQQKK